MNYDTLNQFQSILASKEEQSLFEKRLIAEIELVKERCSDQNRHDYSLLSRSRLEDSFEINHGLPIRSWSHDHPDLITIADQVIQQSKGRIVLVDRCPVCGNDM